MKRSNVDFLAKSRLGLAVILGTSMGMTSIVGCSSGSPKLGAQESSSDEEDSSDSSEDEEAKKSSQTKSGDTGSTAESGPKSSEKSDKSETESSTEKLPDPKALEAELAFKDAAEVKAKLRFTLDVELGISELGGKLGQSVFGTKLKFVDGKMKVSIPPLGKDVDFGDEEDDEMFKGIANLLGTVYEDANKNKRFDKGEKIFGTLSTPILYSRPGNGQGFEEWQILGNGGPEPIEGPLKIFRLDKVEAVETLDIGGKIADLKIDVSHVASLTMGEIEDLKKNFNATGRPFETKLNKEEKKWKADLGKGVDDARRRKGGYPMLPGFKKPAMEFPVGYLENESNKGKLKPDTKYTHLCIAEGGGASEMFTPALLVWIEPGVDWIEGQNGAFLAARYAFNPGWNILAAYMTFDDDLMYYPVNEGHRMTLHASEKCSLKLKDGGDSENDSSSDETSTESKTGDSTSSEMKPAPRVLRAGRPFRRF